MDLTLLSLSIKIFEFESPPPPPPPPPPPKKSGGHSMAYKDIINKYINK